MSIRPTSLRWLASFSASCLHAANAVARGRSLTDPRLGAAVVEPARVLMEAIGDLPVPAPRFWRQLLALAHQIENNRELAAVSLQKTLGRKPIVDSLAPRLAATIAELENAVRQAVPGIVDELEMRSRPLRELWEARGPGLLLGVGRRTDPRLPPEHAEVVLVLPALGGGGEAHLVNNSVRIEAVLTNTVPQLPEVVRLGWLLAQVNCDLPEFSESISPDRLPFLSALALIPPVLTVAQDVELGECNPQTVSAAISAWLPDPITDRAVSENLLVWWQTYKESRPEWRTALGALDKMLP